MPGQNRGHAGAGSGYPKIMCGTSEGKRPPVSSLQSYCIGGKEERKGGRIIGETQRKKGEKEERRKEIMVPIAQLLS